jgi:rubrerythrin
MGWYDDGSEEEHQGTIRLLAARKAAELARRVKLQPQANICHSCGGALTDVECRQKNCPYCGEQI